MGGETEERWKVTDSNDLEAAILPRSVLSPSVRVITVIPRRKPQNRSVYSGDATETESIPNQPGC